MNKYNNQKTEVFGKLFASKREAKRYRELRLLLRAGEILDLECQVVVPCAVNGKHVCNYIADFRYKTRAGAVVYEDAKGFPTDVYKLKKKLVRVCSSIEIQEV